jgi:hypothetical protein
MAQIVRAFYVLLALFVLSLSDDGRIALASPSEAANPKPQGIPIYPVWRLLTHEQKTQYLAGYVQGWKDASRVTDIAIEFVKENPEDAVKGLEQLKSLYDLSDLSPSLLVVQIDNYLSSVENREAPLSLAISAARVGAR